MTKTVVHMIGQAHLDPVWLWRWTEGRAGALATAQSAVDRLREYPDFHFVRGESQVYQWIEQENHELFAEIINLIREGRWHVVNGMIVQPDMNLPQGEALVRQVLLAKSYMREHLGVEPDVAYCVDSFGHPGTLPQVLKKCGFDSYVFMRPGAHEKELPAETFWWQGPDGSRVLAFRIAVAYQTRNLDQNEHIQAAVHAKPPQLSHTMCFFGLGDHGGGPTKQQIENVKAIARLRDDLVIHFSSPEAYFNAIAAEADGLPTVIDELNCHAVGCYSAHSTLKRLYRQAECSLLSAERMAALAQIWVDRQAPLELLNRLWHDLSFNQFHDTLCGTGIKEAEDEATMALGRIVLTSREIANDACRAIAAQIDTSGPGGTVVLFNPGSEAVTEYVEYEPWTDWQPWEAGRWGLTNGQGQPVAYQLIETHEALTSDVGALNRIVFQASVPAMGYRVYRLAPDAPKLSIPADVRALADGLENERLVVRFDRVSGAIVSCLNKAGGVEFVGPSGWNVAQVLEDTSDTWSHGVLGFDQVIGTFGKACISVVDHGPLQASLLVERSYEGNTWLQQIILRQGACELLVRNWLSWQGRWRMLKLAFDVPTDAPQAAHDIPFGWCYRPCNGHEVPMQMWMDVAGPARKHDSHGQAVGLALINDGKYGCDAAGSTIRLTISRCPPYAYHQPHRIGSKQRYDWMDQGQQEFHLVLCPHMGDWRDADVVKRARAFNLPIVPITMHSHAGKQPLPDSLLEVSSSEIEMTALKPAQDGNGYILRLADRHGRGGIGELRWAGERFPVELAPFEVFTFSITQRTSPAGLRPDGTWQDGDGTGAGGWQVTACDMLEHPLPVDAAGISPQTYQTEAFGCDF